MPQFRYQCPDHGVFLIYGEETRRKTYPCGACSKDSIPVISVPGSQIVEVLDNGVMARKVERLHNVEEILDEVSVQDDQKNSGTNE